ncbi:MerR family transcriptional regulator [Mucilaginibacter rubeus]|uniref:MerR family transcriptional regulator n=1 Tax=Mucilaginibacter rubeus TaxID=2027860 RepID=A0AAE6JKN9_9SPHI|nr:MULTISPECIES: MerR family transcriptional regulator [Mucilaginibacter]QEM07794.1 MerR family transcriptional regulator [Mucilaginibacter rubeus]QEM20246.1 MerR family transcriptional regulator [Mucilaginibacter gossypii]QTE43036.1 MerR family transcriptional regulator [Mucilaginibacter rubeus]QTE49637.1 MerR family transcriptional regulator [Mucilaginibacter rubeus]QTE54732.1 MerR family transcriptional regulator [Mucilaginibacter rubeus]
MLIGELVAKTGFSRDTIRFYEKQGLIIIDRKERRNNNYKEYSDAILQKLLVVKKLKGFGFTLNETLDYLELIDNNAASCASVTDKVNEKVKQIEQKITELLELRNSMINMVTTCINCCEPANPEDNCPIFTD